MHKKIYIIVSIILLGAVLFIFRNDIRNRIEMIVLDRTMETSSRLDMLKVDKVVRTLDLKPGQKVADIGAGTGLFTWPMARRIAPDGVVYAIDINPLMLSGIKDKARSSGIANVRIVRALENDPLIPEKVDLIFSCGTIHYIENQAGYFKNLHKYLREGGTIAIIDLEKDHPLVGNRIKYSPEQQREWMKQAGFVLSKKYNFLKHFYFVVYRKDMTSR